MAIIYLIYFVNSNWGTEVDPEFKGYCSGNEKESKGFGKTKN